MRHSRVVALSGGTGSAKFLRGLKGTIERFTIVANVGDNFWFQGLYVCPDVDTVTYALAGVLDTSKGWGLRKDEFKALSQLKKLGARDTWFNIGDMDMATHLLRTALLREGKGLTEITSRIARAYGVSSIEVLPASDEHVETRINTKEKGELHLQEFWVREKGLPTPTSVRYVGADRARPSDMVSRRVASAGRVIFSPANPVTSISPILSLRGFRESLLASSARKVAVSPMLGDRAFSGPAAKFMASHGLDPTSEGVARLYKGLVDAMVVDESDRPMARAIEKLGISCHFASTLMRSHEDEIRLARVAMEV